MENIVYQTDDDFLLEGEGPQVGETWRNILVCENNEKQYDLYLQLWDVNSGKSKHAFLDMSKSKDIAIKLSKELISKYSYS